MPLLDFKRNIGQTDMIVRVILGSILLFVGIMRVFPGFFSVLAIFFGAATIVEGFARY